MISCNNDSNNVFDVSLASKEEISLFCDVSENMLKRINEPHNGYFIAESPKVIERAMDAGYEPLMMLMERKHLVGEAKEVAARAEDIRIYVGETARIRDILGYELTRGALCLMRRRDYPSITDCFGNMRRIVILDNVENPTNIGAIVRSAAALGVEGILFANGCADPLFRRTIRVSMGNIFLIPWTVINKGDYMNEIHKLGFKTVAMALEENSVEIDNELLNSEDKIAIIMGNEGDGLPKETVKCCDYTVMIPMRKGVDSLNVSAAAAIAFWKFGLKDKDK